MLQTPRRDDEKVSYMQNLVERAVVLGHGANKEETSAALAALVNQYAGILAAQVLPISICKI